MIFADFFRALAQLDDPKFRRVLWIGVALSLALLVGFYAGLLWVIDWLDPGTLTLPIVGQVTWLGDLLGWASLLFMLVFSMFLMIPVASAITSLFLDDVAQAVEDRHYPGLPDPPRVGFYEALKDTINFLGVILIANFGAIVVYVFLPPATPFIFYALNGYLLGREYFHIAATRRMSSVRAKALRAQNSGTIWAAGILMTIPLSIPLVNLLVPVLGAATFTHLFHRVARPD